MEDTNRSARRYHGQDLKKAVLHECRAGASVASVAMAHGLNANLDSGLASMAATRGSFRSRSYRVI